MVGITGKVGAAGAATNGPIPLFARKVSCPLHGSVYYCWMTDNDQASVERRRRSKAMGMEIMDMPQGLITLIPDMDLKTTCEI